MAVARNLRTVLIFGGFISMVGAAFYPIYFRPLMRLEEYRGGVKKLKPEVSLKTSKQSQTVLARAALSMVVSSAGWDTQTL
ncbi:small integral membrane protein 20 isoform X2 [Onychomys torridus]|uniref:small integral membrane protein 20 isoform X2 n=1 Tax=Onychomys torridus TaxID=38674 RepID=UPI00167F4562|nr:small integral membrane protein 20 isoform X2 [Onychomys torridus]